MSGRIESGVGCLKYGAERAQRAATSENTCKLRKQLPQFDNTQAANAHNTTQKRNAMQKNLFGCVIMSTCTICCQNGENVFLICWCFFYLHAGPALGMGRGGLSPPRAI